MESVCWRGILRNSWTVWNNPLREVWGGSAAPYAIAAGTINSLLAKTAALHENAIDIQQTVNISAWHTSDGTLHLLAANLEEGLRDDAEADRRSTIALPVPWRDHDWSSIWGSCEIAHSAGTVAIDLGQSESVLLKAKEPRRLQIGAGLHSHSFTPSPPGSSLQGTYARATGNVPDMPLRSRPCAGLC